MTSNDKLKNSEAAAPTSPANFIRDIIMEDVKSGKWDSKVITRFPPEPNGYLHIGHAKAICIDFGMAKEFNGECHLRYDDTNPGKEDEEYVSSIERDVRWLGFNWGTHLYYASDYFERMFEWAIQLIKDGKAYVDDLTADEIREYRGTLTQPGKESPYRNRSIEENLDLFHRMQEGKLEDGSHVLRAKIDMTHPNMNMRDPVMYRISKVPHHRQGMRWNVYPMYDWAHGLEDSIEGITYSLCSLEFEDHRPLYDWFLDQLPIHHPQQIEFARLHLTYTVMSKRKLLTLVKEGYVNGWDDPRLPTLGGMRRRGYTAEAIRTFCERIGVAKRDSIIDIAFLEHCLREDLNKRALRYMAVLNPLKVIIDNFPENDVEEIEAVNNPEDSSAGKRNVPFSKVLYIEQDDFMENPPKKFFRLAPQREVRLRYAYFITCTDVVKDPSTGAITEIHCTYDPATRGGSSPDGRSPKATLHWVSAQHAKDATIHLYDHLFTKENPDDAPDGNFLSNLNLDSISIRKHCKIEPALAAVSGECIPVQFERMGYFCADTDSTEKTPIFNRTVTLRDEWAKIAKRSENKK